MKKKTSNKRPNTMSNKTFAELELSLKEVLAYEKGQIDGLRVTKRAIPQAPKKGQRPQ